jgi:hypothetical protein
MSVVVLFAHSGVKDPPLKFPRGKGANPTIFLRTLNFNIITIVVVDSFVEIHHLSGRPKREYTELSAMPGLSAAEPFAFHFGRDM